MEPAGDAESAGFSPACVISNCTALDAGSVLHNDGALRQQVAMAHVPDLQRDEAASAWLAVDAEAEQREFTHPVFHLEPDP